MTAAKFVVAFKQSESEDVVKNRVRFGTAGGEFDENAPFHEIDKPAPETDGLTRIDLAPFAKEDKLDGRVNIYVTAVDDAGLEGPPVVLANEEVDFTPPLAPTQAKIER